MFSYFAVVYLALIYMTYLFVQPKYIHKYVIQNSKYEGNNGCYSVVQLIYF